MSTSTRTKAFPQLGRAAGLWVQQWDVWRWRPLSQVVARSNAQRASVALAEQRVERDDVDDFCERLAVERTLPRRDPR